VSKSNIAKLEEKLDGLVTLLKSSQESGSTKALPVPSSSIINATALAENSTPLTENPTVSSTIQIRAGWSHAHDQEQPSLPLAQAPPALEKNSKTHDIPTTQLLSGSEPNFEDSDVLLSIFRDQMSSCFPFVVIPPNISAGDLRRDRPFLLDAILAVSSRNSTRQILLGKEVVKKLAERVFVNGDRNLDLLLGTLTYAGWYASPMCP
jgi:hypothetical protein